MQHRKVTLHKTSVVAFKNIQASLPNSGFRIVFIDSLYQVIYVKKDVSFSSRFLTFKIQLAGIGNKTNITINPDGVISILFKFRHDLIANILNDLEKVLEKS